MKSMRRRLVLALVGGMLTVSVAIGIGLYIYIRGALIGENDLALAAKAQMAAECVHLERSHYVLDMSDDAVTEFSEGRRYFQIWSADGSVFARSPSLGAAQSLAAVAPSPKAIAFADIQLPNGNTARAVTFHFVPQPDDADDVPVTATDKANAAAGLTILAARDRGIIDHRLDRIIAALFGATLAFTLVLWLMFALTVRRGLRPLSNIADEASRIDANNLQLRLSTENLPEELLPICVRFNDLLNRLDAAFSRERRFTANVAHELRTPIAELKSLAEVALRWPDDSTSAGSGFRDALDIAQHMERMVTTLITLSRYEAGRLAAHPRTVDFSALITDAWHTAQAEADIRQLRARFDIASACMIQSDPDLLAAIVSNLISNAVQYAPSGSEISCSLATIGGKTVKFSISNLADSLEPADLPHLFEPFWQKDASRSRSDHSGLGLPLVKAYAGILGARIDLAIDEKKIFHVVVELPVGSVEDAAAQAALQSAPA